MSDFHLYLFHYSKDKNEATRIAAHTAEDLESKRFKLLELVESLGEFLNSDDGPTRAKAMAYLADILSVVSPNIFTRQHRNLLCDFILSRIASDNEGIGFAARALLALAERGAWENERVASVLSSLVQHAHPLRQFKSQGERYSILLLIDMLLAKYREAVHSVHKTAPEFLSRFISFFDGEKDPRNLMIVFSILNVPMTAWNLGSDAQDLFDAVFNYFPITFRPPPDDPYRITSQDLKVRLRECIASTDAFAPYSFPALFDKLDASAINTKRDALQALTACVQRYSPNTLSRYSVTLWDTLKFEILSAQDEQLADEALQCLTELARQLSQSTAGYLGAYLKPIQKECNEHLEDTPTKQSTASGKILHAISKVSVEAEDSVLHAVLPNIFTIYQTTDTMAKKRGLIEILDQLIRADIAVYGEWRLASSDAVQTVSRPADNALLKFCHQALEVMSDGLATAPIQEVSFPLAALDGLLQLARARSILDDDGIGKVIGLFNDMAISEESYGMVDVKNAAVAGLVEIARQKPQLVIDQAFPAFMAKLPVKDTEGPESYAPVLKAFATLATEQQVFPTVILRLKNKLNTATQKGASTDYIVALLSAQLFAFSTRTVALESPTSMRPYYDEIVRPLLSQVSNPTASTFSGEITLDIIGRLCNTIIQHQTTEFQRDHITPEVYTLLSGQSVESIPPYDQTSSPEKQQRMIVSTYVLAALRRDAISSMDIKTLLDVLVGFATLEGLSPPVFHATNSQICLLFNKFIASAETKDAISTVLFDPWHLLSTEKLNQRGIRVIFACIKGLVLRNARGLNTTLPSLIELLRDPAHGITVARGFATILAPHDLLTTKNYCLISGLHKQKAFNLIVPAIVAAFKTADPAVKPNFLIALSGILRWVSYEIIEPELARLVPLLLQCLDLQQVQVPQAHHQLIDDAKNATIDTLTDVLTSGPGAVEEHAAALITRLLNTASIALGLDKSATTAPASASSPALRANALTCLTLVPERLRGEVILPFRQQVVRRLMAALDDSKRAVRAEAVRCRTAWLNMDEVDDDDVE